MGNQASGRVSSLAPYSICSGFDRQQLTVMPLSNAPRAALGQKPLICICECGVNKVPYKLSRATL